MSDLYNKLKNNSKIPFHMPGHKRNTTLLGNKLPYDIDITEIEGFDNLHSPEGIILELEEKLSRIYRSKKSFPLVNGSTVGILAAVSALASVGDTVLVARNCHKSVYNAIEINRLRAEYIEPEYDEFGIAKGITATQIRENLDGVSLVIITSPTYEGVKSEVKEICGLAHKYGVPVLVDSAHGAHFFEDCIDADVVICSLHKTLPALTQCAVANLYGDIVDEKTFGTKLSVFETSSPSYVLLASIDECADFILNRADEFEKYQNRLKDFYDIKLNRLRLIKTDDPGKIIVFTGYAFIHGAKFAELLRKRYNIEPEMVSENYLVLMTSVCDSDESFDVLKTALNELDCFCSEKALLSEIKLPRDIPEKFCEAFEADKGQPEILKDSHGKISSEYVWAYPPGIPILVPGEIIGEEVLAYIKHLTLRNVNIQSTSGLLPEKILCYKP